MVQQMIATAIDPDEPTICPACGKWSRFQNAIWASAIASVGIENPRVRGLMCECPYTIESEEDG